MTSQGRLRRQVRPPRRQGNSRPGRTSLGWSRCSWQCLADRKPFQCTSRRNPVTNKVQKHQQCVVVTKMQQMCCDRGSYTHSIVTDVRGQDITMNSCRWWTQFDAFMLVVLDSSPSIEMAGSIPISHMLLRSFAADRMVAILPDIHTLHSHFSATPPPQGLWQHHRKVLDHRAAEMEVTTELDHYLRVLPSLL